LLEGEWGVEDVLMGFGVEVGEDGLEGEFEADWDALVVLLKRV
jgi:hypothetical protein